MNEILNYLLKQVAANQLSQEKAKGMIRKLKNSGKNRQQEIAVIGMACRFAGKDNLRDYWEALLQSANCIRPIPEHRKVLPREYNLVYPHKGYLEEIDKFDPLFFNISPREARYMSPAQRMMMETAYSAVEDAGYATGRLRKSNTGVYIGHDHSMGKDYRHYCIDRADGDPLVSSGSYPGILSGRISHYFKLSGPSLVVDTACSSGAVAVHLACEAISANQCGMAIAGGVFVSAIGFGDAGMSMIVGEDEALRCFDNRANGTITGEGVAAVVLKPLQKALAERDNIYAVIKGSCMNNDGAAASGLLTPNAESQEEVLLNTWKKLNIKPEDLSYIEAQSTGTKIGDPIEIMALTNAFRRFTQKKQFCGIGCAKANIGHTVSASGLAAFIKVALALHTKTLPAMINFAIPNSFIDFCNSPVYINDRTVEWKVPEDKKRLAAINSFGFSGTNCHLVLEEAPEAPEGIEENNAPCLVTITAKEPEVLLRLVKLYLEHLSFRQELNLTNISYTTLVKRPHFRNRLAFIAHSPRELCDQLQIVLASGLIGYPEKGIYYGTHTIVNKMTDMRGEGVVTGRQKQELSEKAREVLVKYPFPQNKAAESLALLCELYTRGAELETEKLFLHNKPFTLSLPTYPFKRERYWAEEKSTEPRPALETGQILPGNILVDSNSSLFFEAQFSSVNFWPLGEHKIFGRNVLPGTVYLEIMREVWSAQQENGLDKDRFCIKTLMFRNLLDAGSEERVQLQTIIQKQKNGSLAIEIGSRNEGQWLEHASGTVGSAAGSVPSALDMEALKARYTGDELVSELKKMEDTAEFGPHWQNIQSIHLGTEGILVELMLPPEFREETDLYKLHPALSDNALNIWMRLKQYEEFYIPSSYGCITVYEPLPSHFFSSITRRPLTAEDNDMLAYDVLFLNPAGKVLADIKDYRVKKIKKQALKTSSTTISVFKGNSEEGLTDLEKKIGRVWAEVLGLSRIDIYEPLQNLGGDSLLVMKLHQVMDKSFPELGLSLTDIYTSNTVHGMGQLIEKYNSPNQDGNRQAIPVFDSMHALRREAVLDDSICWQSDNIPSHFEYNRIFITGTTGFLGAYLLDSLLALTSARVYCLVRAGNEKAAMARIEGNARKYGLWKEAERHRIHAVVGDLAGKNLGMSQEEYTKLARTCDQIVHNGALMNFIFPYSHLKTVNVQGTSEILKFAVTGKLKPVHYISSLYIYYQDRLEGHSTIYETDPADAFDIPPIGYTQSKLIAEIILAEAKKRNIPVNIFRPVTIAGDSETGACTSDDFMWRMIKGCLQLKMYPEMDFPINIYPVNLLSRAIIHLSMKEESRGQAFNFVNSEPGGFLELMRMLVEKGYNLKPIGMGEWISGLKGDESGGNALAALMPLFSDKNLALKVFHNHYHNELTRQALQDTEYNCPAVDRELLEKYIDYFRETGFFPDV